MAFTIPNLSAATWEAQARLFSSDITIWTMAAGGQNGVVSGCAVTAQTPAAMAVDVAAGTIVVAGTQVTVAGNAVSITAANATYARLDIIYISDVGVAAVSTGTAAPAPVPNALPADSVGVAFVYVPALDVAIGSTQITDKRVFVPTPLGASQWTTVSKAADETRNSTTTLTVDDTLSFTMAANTKYRVRMMVVGYCAATPDFKWRHAGPASPTLVVLRRRAMYGTSSETNIGIDTAYSAADLLISGETSFVIELFGVIHNGATPGDFEFRWAQNTSDAGNTTVRAGSFLEHEVA